MNVLLGIGIIVFIGIGCVLILYPVHVVATHHHLHYRFDFPLVITKLIWLFDILYFMATIITPFISGIKRMKWLGIISLTFQHGLKILNETLHYTMPNIPQPTHNAMHGNMGGNDSKGRLRAGTAFKLWIKIPGPAWYQVLL